MRDADLRGDDQTELPGGTSADSGGRVGASKISTRPIPSDE